VAFGGSGPIRRVAFGGSDPIRRVSFGGSGHLRRGGGLMYMTIFQLIIDFFFFAAYIL
jgi:hypothetical protein